MPNYYIRMDGETDKKRTLIQSLAAFADLEVHPVIEVYTDDQHVAPLLESLAEYVRFAYKAPEIQAEEQDAEETEEPEEKPAKTCAECGEPHDRRSKFCSSACYQRDYARRQDDDSEGEDDEQESAGNGNLYTLPDGNLLSSRQLNSRLRAHDLPIGAVIRNGSASYRVIEGANRKLELVEA